MKTTNPALERTKPIILAGWLCICLIPSAMTQSWNDFAHPDEPHEIGSPLPPLVFEELFDDPTLTITVPMVVVLMDFSDQGPEYPLTNSPAKYRRIVFGQNLPDGSPTVREYYNQATNGRIQIVPAEENHGQNNDGVIGWITAQGGDSEFYNDNDHLREKRAEAIRLVDDYIDYSQFDTDGDNVISAHELIFFLVNPGDGGGTTQSTAPASVTVDDGAIEVNLPVGALGETQRAVPIAHETSHSFFGHTDIYRKCEESWQVGDGYICEILIDDCSFPQNSSCSCPDALDASTNETVTGDTEGLPITSEGACGGASAINSPAAWYEVYGNGNTFTATTCGAITGFDTQITVFCNSCDGLTCVGGNDNDPDCGDPNASSISWCTKPGASYLIAIHGGSGASGPFGLRVSDTGSACNNPQDCGLIASHARHWYPFNPSWISIMSSGYNHQNETPITLDPWSKIHLGFTRPRILTHNGTYTIHAEEAVRSIAQQTSQPEAYIIFDPQKPLSERYNEYFIVEARNDLELNDQGLAVWLINEEALPYPNGGTNYRRVVRLIHRGGHNSPVASFLWDGGDFYYYDLTADSSPRNSNWTDGTPSYIEVYDISEAGSSMQFSVQIPPIFVDDSNSSSTQRGSHDFPFRVFEEGVDNISDAPRTILIAEGDYPEAITITTPCTIKHWQGGSAIIGN